MLNTVGIDVGAKSVDVVSFKAGTCSKSDIFTQTVKGHRALIARLKTLNPDCIVMEATGVYYFDLAVALHDAGLPVSVINPKSSKHFAQIKLQNSKTDAIDAALLAEYGARMEPRRWTPPSAEKQALRSLGRQINRLIHARTQAKNQLHAMEATQSTPAILMDDQREAIATLDHRIERMRKAAHDILNENAELKRVHQHFSAAKGIADASALALLAELCVLPDHLKSSQVSRHAGLDVRLHQSGSSVNQKARISKTGNVYIRAALYMPAMSAISSDPRVTAFRDALVARGKTKLQAQVAVMRKYLTGLWACIKTDTPFNSALLFSEIHAKQG